MKVGVICEGHTDRAVIAKILKGLKGIDSSQIVPLRPDYSKDETDLAVNPIDSFGSWTNVREECRNREKITRFLSIEDQGMIIIQLDSAESHDFGITKPAKDKNYSTVLRERIIEKINEWLDNEFLEETIYAVAIEETEAWVLTIYEKRNSTASADPKARLKRVLGKKGVKYTHNLEGFSDISDKFSKRKNFVKEKYLTFNQSLADFCQEVEDKL
ncbi:MAG TPA: hypothetical protein DDW81_14555 [Cryomorphaceae bacterium]|nr:hypothetical protein [Owenweeksia sp.]HBF21320.1 hypothetical protein [Cryomorphaceae bacterium]|tara:strand:- start:1464 stop:2108 length:645 start_codon:yes stop_codon:yes gene_type:complete